MYKELTFVTAATAALLMASAPDATAGIKTPVPVKCSSQKIKKAYRAKHGQFKIASGLAVETRSGNVGRAPLKVKKGCVVEASPGDVVLLEFKAAAKKKLRYLSRFEMQCVDAKAPTGKFLSYDAAPQASVADGKAWTPPCSAQGLTKIEKKSCSKGISNSDRHSQWKKNLQKRKKFALEFFVRDDPSTYTRRSEPLVGSDRKGTTAAEVAPSGRLFCQWFDKNEKKAVFAVMFDVPKS